MTDSGARPPRAVRMAWLAAGWLFFGIGVAGAALPGLPTTAPMLVAVACFARGSDRLHWWLLNHRGFGPPLRRWQEHRSISPRAKATALVMMAGSIVVLLYATEFPAWLLVTTIAFVLFGMVFVARLPHGPQEPSD